MKTSTMTRTQTLGERAFYTRQGKGTMFKCP